MAGGWQLEGGEGAYTLLFPACDLPYMISGVARRIAVSCMAVSYVSSAWVICVRLCLCLEKLKDLPELCVIEVDFGTDALLG